MTLLMPVHQTLLTMYCVGEQGRQESVVEHLKRRQEEQAEEHMGKMKVWEEEVGGGANHRQIYELKAWNRERERERERGGEGERERERSNRCQLRYFYHKQMIEL
jgi:hypothetical protein